MQFPGYLLYGIMMLGGLSWAEYHGYSLSRVDQVKNVPKTVRDNPGAYRSHYGFYPRYVGGK
jgi:hypothetical protein